MPGNDERTAARKKSITSHRLVNLSGNIHKHDDRYDTFWTEFNPCGDNIRYGKGVLRGRSRREKGEE